MSVTFADIEAAAARLEGHAVRTPLVESPALNERLGGRVLLKVETLQRVGAFKFRGAYNRLVQLSADERQRGVVAFSSGNHAQGVALAAQVRWDAAWGDIFARLAHPDGIDVLREHVLEGRAGRGCIAEALFGFGSEQESRHALASLEQRVRRSRLAARQKAPAASRDGRGGELSVGGHLVGVGDGAVSADPVGLGHGVFLSR